MGKSYIFRVLIEPDEDRYHAEIPALPGCYSWGYTYEEALKNIKEAAELWLETLTEDGEPIPEEDPQTLKDAPITLGIILYYGHHPSTKSCCQGVGQGTRT